MMKLNEKEYVLSVDEIESLINKCIYAIQNHKSEQYQELSDKLDEALVVVKAWRKKKDEEKLEETLDTILARFDRFLPTDCSLGDYEQILRSIIKEEFCKLTGKIRTREW